MQNLGYFQLQATPGVWDLSLAPGRASELYSLVAPEEDEGSGLVFNTGRRRHTMVEGEGDECVRVCVCRRGCCTDVCNLARCSLGVQLRVSTVTHGAGAGLFWAYHSPEGS